MSGILAVPTRAHSCEKDIGFSVSTYSKEHRWYPSHLSLAQDLAHLHACAWPRVNISVRVKECCEYEIETTNVTVSPESGLLSLSSGEDRPLVLNGF